MRCGLPGFATKGFSGFMPMTTRRECGARMVDKLRKLLFALETADALDQMSRFPGWKLHPLKGDLKGFWSLTVTGNWRLISRYDETANTASDIDLVDYH
jgi:proteic killer suppression protein